MPDMFFDVDAAVTVPVNLLPLVDDTDFKTRETAVAYNASGMDLVWNFVTSAGVQTQTAVTPTTGGDYDWSHVGDGLYKIEIPASGGASVNNDAEGYGWFSGLVTGVLPFRGPVVGFRASGLNDLMVDNAYSTTRGLAGTALPNAAADAAGGLPISDAGGLDLDAKLAVATSALATPTNITAGTITTVTNLTNAPTSGDLTATMKASVTTAATSATPTVTLASSQPSYAPAKAGDAMALTSGERTTLAGVVWAALTSGLTTVGSIGKLLVDNINAAISSRSSHSAADVWAAGTRTLTSAANITSTGGTTVPQTGDSYAVVSSGTHGNAAIKTLIETVDNVVDAILVDTGTDGVVVASGSKTGYALTTAERDAIAAALLDLTSGVETNRTLRQALRLILAAAAGKISGAATTSVVIRDTNDTTNRISAVVDEDGNRSSVTYDAS